MLIKNKQKKKNYEKVDFIVIFILIKKKKN